MSIYLVFIFKLLDNNHKNLMVLISLQVKCYDTVSFLLYSYCRFFLPPSIPVFEKRPMLLILLWENQQLINMNIWDRANHWPLSYSFLSINENKIVRFLYSRVVDKMFLNIYILKEHQFISKNQSDHSGIQT